ncbi:MULTISPECIES: hypothetical protein [unclassified Luteibacter]|uniref:hypothetical protein n=1 Tax=Luteibacter sp. PvP019 TaxID=3156436 RepID=UPI0033967D47
MAGKRQHYIPKFLQRGFLARNHPPEKGECTWWHFRGNPAKPLQISNIGVEEYFYSRLRKDGVPTLDDQITEQESDIGIDLRTAMDAPAETSLDSALSARLVTHFVLRTAFIRSTFTEAALNVLDAVIDVVGTPKGARAHLGIDEASLSPHVLGIVETVTAHLHASNVAIPLRLAERMLPYMLRERFDEFMGDFESTIAQVQSVFLAEMPATVAGVHKKVLAQGEHRAWEAGLSRLTWRTHAVDGAVLPDCIAIARGKGREWGPLMLVGVDAMETCVFPLADHRLLVGTLDPAFVPDLSEINRACVSCSDDFFIAAVCMDHLGAKLGMRTSKIILDEIDEALHDLRRHSTSEGVIPTDQVPLAAEEPAPFAYTLHYPLLDDPAQGTALQRLVTIVVYEMSRKLPLESLDGITFAVDYPAALAQLDRGEPALAPDLSEPRAYGTPVAKCVSVQRDGHAKQHLVFGLAIAGGLLSDDEAIQRSSLQTIVSMLGHIAHDTRYSWPLAATHPTFPDEFTQVIHRAADSCPGYYYTSRVAAYTDPAAGQRYAELFRDCLQLSREEMAAAQDEYARSNDIDALLNTGLLHARHLMGHAAQWCGHMDGLNSEELADEMGTGQALMRDIVMSAGLDAWLALLRQDLQDLYDPSQSFSADRIFGLLRHAERLLWTFRVWPWPMADGRIYVTVPVPDPRGIGLLG